MPRVVRSRAELRAGLADLPGRGLVPTMGALHAGHLALVRAAKAVGPAVASIFVNPLQFSASEDLSRYPRDEAGDIALLAEAGCDLVFIPQVTDVYPPGDATVVDVAGPALGFEGARRPGHFRGVATVVARLLALVQPNTAWFGEKDWQQLQVIRRMTADLGLPVAIHAGPTVRAPDGLALSSRNRFLSPAERALAPRLPALCQSLAGRIAAGIPIGPVLADAMAALTALGFAPDYLAAVHAESLAPLTHIAPPARLIVAAQLGSVRLLDNFHIS